MRLSPQQKAQPKTFVTTGLFVLLATYGAAEGATISVSITQGSFVPDNLTIRTGDTVVWTNDSIDTFDVTSYTAEWRGVVSNYSQVTFSNTFNSPGEYPYKVEWRFIDYGFILGGGVIRVLPSNPPVMLNAPFEGLETTWGGIYLVASVTNDPHSIYRVDFHAEGTNFLGTVTTPPYQVRGYLGIPPSDAPEERVLTATAFTYSGSATSAPVRVLVYPAQHLSAPRFVKPGVFFFNYSCPGDGRRGWTTQLSTNLIDWDGCGNLSPHYGTIAVENAFDKCSFFRVVWCP